MKVVTSSDFNSQVLENNGVVLVDFYADWCGPCKMVAPVLEQLSEEIKEAEFVKINVDDAGEIANQYGVMSIPTLLVFKGGEVKETLVGFKPKEEIESKVKAHI